MIYGHSCIWQLIEQKKIDLGEIAYSEYYKKKGKEKEDLVSGCNCDLYIGDECYISDYSDQYEKNLHSLKLCKSIEIAPMGIMLFETEASFHIPNDCAFRLSLRMKYIKKGLLMPNQPLGQPGYEGKLFGMVMNISNRPIRIEHRERMLTLEVIEVKGNPYHLPHKRAGTTMNSFSEEAIRTSFEEELRKMRKKARILKKQRKQIENRLKRHTNFQTWALSLAGVWLMLLTVLVTIIIAKPQ